MGWRRAVLAVIAPQESLNAMASLVGVGAGISRGELVRETALSFGLRRITPKVGGHLSTVLDLGIQKLRFGDHSRVVKNAARARTIRARQSGRPPVTNVVSRIEASTGASSRS